MRRGEDLARHYAAMDVLLFASETETFGNVLLEGMASGLATVSYRYAASADVVLDDINGLQAEKGDEEGFYSAMRRLLEDGEMIRRLGKQARRTVNSRTWDSIHDRFEELLASVAREENGTGCARPRGMPCWNAARFFVGPSSGNERLQGGRMPEVSETCPGWKNCAGGGYCGCLGFVPRQPLAAEAYALCPHLVEKMEQEDVEVLYLRGNHDDILEKFLPFHLGGLKIAREYVHQAADGRRYLCVHGDGFDAISTNHRWLAMLGSLGYDVLLMVNRFYNKYRAWRGREYYSVSRAIKGRVKSAVNFIGKYEEQLQRLAVKRQCDGIIAGHVHHPADTMVGKVRYLNCGDWVETMSAVLEYGDGRMETVLYKDFMKRLAYGKCGTMEDAETSPGTGDS